MQWLFGRLLIGLGNPGSDYERTRHNVGFRLVDRIAAARGVLFQSVRTLDLDALCPPASQISGPPASQNSGPPASQDMGRPAPLELGANAAATSSGSTSKGHGLKGLQVARLVEPGALLLKPTTFMNRSGEPLAALVRQLASRCTPKLPSDASEPVDASSSLVDPENVMVAYDDLDLPLGRLRLRPGGGHGGHNGVRSLIDCLATNQFARLRIGIGRPSTDAARHVLEDFTPTEEIELDLALERASEAALEWLGRGDLDGCMTRFHSRWSQED